MTTEIKYLPRRIVIVGCGGIGSQLVRPLFMYLSYLVEGGFKGEVILVDGDNFEARNSQRQIFGISEVGRNKAQVLASMYRRDFPLNIRAQGLYLNEDNARHIISEDSVVFSCVDNHKTRKLISDRCKEMFDVSLISGGNDYHDGNVQCYQRIGGEEVCWPIDHMGHPEIANPQDLHPSEVEQHCHTEVEASPQLVFANLTAATLMNNAFFHLTTQGKVKEADLYFDCLQNRAAA